MKNKFIVLLMLISFGINAQNDKEHVDKLVSEFTQSLEERGISNYFHFTKYCNGRIEMFRISNGKMCTSKGTYYEVYVFWEEDQETLIKKIDNCGLFYSLPVVNEDIMSFVYSNTNNLKEQVKKYEVETPENIPIKQSEIHPCFNTFQFNLNNEIFGQTYNLYQLTNESKYKNLNFDYNNGLRIIELEKLINLEISGMNSKLRRQL